MRDSTIAPSTMTASLYVFLGNGSSSISLHSASFRQHFVSRKNSMTFCRVPILSQQHSSPHISVHCCFSPTSGTLIYHSHYLDHFVRCAVRWLYHVDFLQAQSLQSCFLQQALQSAHRILQALATFWMLDSPQIAGYESPLS